MGEMSELTAADGHRLAAYRAVPAGRAQGGLVEIREIFGIRHRCHAIRHRPVAALHDRPADGPRTTGLSEIQFGTILTIASLPLIVGTPFWGS